MVADQPVNGVTCGIDWVREDHAVAIIDGGGRSIYRGVIEHTARGLTELIAILARTGVNEVGIESPDGPLVDALLDAGVSVVVINPNQIKNLRSRYGSAGNKNERIHTFVLDDKRGTP